MHMTFLRPEEIDRKELMPGCTARLIHSENMTVACWSLDKGAEIPVHSHPHEQVSYVIEGDFEFTVGGRKKRMGPHHAAVIPPDTVHSGKALSACLILDVFHPVREEYR